MKKAISVLLAALLTATVFAGCTVSTGDTGDTSSTGSTGSTKGTPSNKVTITAAEDLKNYSIGCQGGTTGETWVTENCGAAPKSYKSGMDAALDLKNGRIDVIVLDELPAKAIVGKNDDLMILDLKFAKEEYAIAVAKGNTALLTVINDTIAGMKEAGKYEELVNAFMPADGKIVVPDEVKTTGDPLKLGTNAAFPPFEYVEGGKVVGFDISMGQQIAATAKRKLEVNDMAFDTLIAALQSGTIDMVAAGMSITEERLKNVDFSKPYYESEQVIIVKK